MRKYFSVISGFILFIFELSPLLIKYMCFGACLIKQCFVESVVFLPKIHRGQRIFVSKAIAEFSKPQIGSEQVIKLYSNFKSFNLIFPSPKVHLDFIISSAGFIILS